MQLKNCGHSVLQCVINALTHLSMEPLAASCAVKYFPVFVSRRVTEKIVQPGERFPALVAPGN